MICHISINNLIFSIPEFVLVLTSHDELLTPHSKPIGKEGLYFIFFIHYVLSVRLYLSDDKQKGAQI